VPVRADPPKPDAAHQILIDLVTNSTGGLNEKTFTKGEYKHIRAAFTNTSRRGRGGDQAALGEDAEPLFAWLDKNLEVKETLFTAIDRRAKTPRR